MEANWLKASIASRFLSQVNGPRNFALKSWGGSGYPIICPKPETRQNMREL